MHKTSSLIRHLKLIVALFMSVVAFACTPPESERKEDADAAGYILTVPKVDADSIAASGQVACEGACPTGLAMVSARFDRFNETRFNQCTGFLVAGDVIATNAHCLPSDLRRARTSCFGRIKVYFGAQNGLPGEAIDCDSVLSATDIEEDPNAAAFAKRPDFALLRLRDRALYRASLPISRQGLPDRTTLSVWAVDPDLGAKRLRGIARLKTCTTNQMTVAAPLYTHDFGAVAAATCSIRRGNSGSPALDAAGAVRAIVQNTKPEALSKRNKFVDVELPAAFNDVALLANAACLDWSAYTDAWPPSAMCEARITTQGELLKNALISVVPDVSSLAAAWTAPSVFGFETRTVTDRGRTLGYPYLKCVVPVARMNLSAVTGVDDVKVDGTRVTVRYQTPYWGNRAKLDADYRIGVAVATKLTQPTTVTFDLEQLRASGYTRARKVETQADGTTTSSGDFDLLACP